MQPVRSRVVREHALDLVARSCGHAVNTVSDHLAIQTYKNAVDTQAKHVPSGIRILGHANGICREVSDGSQIEKRRARRGMSNDISWTNPGVYQFIRYRSMIGKFCFKDDGLSNGPPQVLPNKLWRSGALLGAGFSTADVRWDFGPSTEGCRAVRNLHTEIKGEKYVREKSQDIIKLRRENSRLEVKASTNKRRRSVKRVASTIIPQKPVIELEVADDVSIKEDEQASSTDVDFEAQADREEELETVGAHVSAGLHHDNAEERHDYSGASGQIVHETVPSLGFQTLTIKQEEERDRRASAQAMALLRAALDEGDEEEGPVTEEFQRSLRVGIVGAPNAGKSLLTNQLVGTRVSAVSRKTNTTHREHLGVFTKDETQLLFYDTPGLHLDVEGYPLRVDARHRVRNAWEIVDFCEALVVLVDAERQIRRPDKRVQRLVQKLGKEEISSQKRVLCLNKVDIIDEKRLLLPLAKQFEDLLGFDRIFMISGLTGSGVKDVKDYLVNQAVLRPWDEDPELKDHRDVALEVVREQVFEHLHEELPHTTKQKLVSWKVLKDGSIRIQQVLLVAKKEHQKILVGKNGAIIGDIGIKARKELTDILGATVHLVLDVNVVKDSMTVT